MLILLLKSNHFKIELMLPLLVKTMFNKEFKLKLNKEMIEEVNVKKLHMIINKEELQEILIDKPSVI